MKPGKLKTESQSKRNMTLIKIRDSSFLVFNQLLNYLPNACNAHLIDLHGLVMLKLLRPCILLENAVSLGLNSEIDSREAATVNRDGCGQTGKWIRS